MKRILFDMVKVVVVFVCCSLLFYFGLKAINEEYEQYHKYDPPNGPVMKVYKEDRGLFNFFEKILE